MKFQTWLLFALGVPPLVLELLVGRVALALESGIGGADLASGSLAGVTDPAPLRDRRG